MPDDALYEYVFNAKFWKSIGFRTKRAGQLSVELIEKKYMRRCVAKLLPAIEQTRKTVEKRITERHGNQIEKFNREDEKRTEKKREDKRKKFVDGFVRTRNRISWFTRRTSLERITLDTVIVDTASESTDTEDGYLQEIAEICSKYEDNPCSKEIVDYLKDNNLIQE